MRWFCLLVALLATNSRANSQDSTLAAGGDQTCAVNDAQIVCVGNGQSPPPPLIHPEVVKTGDHHTCALDQGDMRCWGSNIYGEAQPPVHLGLVDEIAVGSHFSCALTGAQVRCWGYDGTGVISSTPRDLVAPHSLQAVDNNVCVLDQGRPRCWGWSALLNEVSASLTHVQKYSMGSLHICAIDGDGPQCWGDGTYFATRILALEPLYQPNFLRIGNGKYCGIKEGVATCWGGVSEQTMPPRDAKVLDLAFTGSNICALIEEAKSRVARCYGRNVSAPQNIRGPRLISSDGDSIVCVVAESGIHCFGGNSVPYLTDVPADLNANPDVITEVANTSTLGCVIAGTAVRCWGSDTTSEYWRTLPPRNLQNPHALKVTYGGGCVVSDAGLHCFGANASPVFDPLVTLPGIAQASEVADFDRRVCAIIAGQVKCNQSFYIIPQDLQTPRALALYDRNTCATTDSGVRCWDKQGHDVLEESPLPYKIEGTFEQIAVGRSYSCAVTNQQGAQQLKCWGSLPYGMASKIRDRPVKDVKISERLVCLEDLSSNWQCLDMAPGWVHWAIQDWQHFESLSVTPYHVCAIDENFRLVCEGDNTLGTLNVPRTLTNPHSVVSGARHSCALADDGIACWGTGRGIGVPFVFKGPNVIDRLYAGNELTCAITKGSGLLDCWGLTNGDRFFQILSGAADAAIGQSHFCATGIEPGTLRCVGSNGSGQLDIPVAAQQGRILALAAGDHHTCALIAGETNSQVECWGANNHGQATVPAGMNQPALLAAGQGHTCAATREGVRCWGLNRDGQASPPAIRGEILELVAGRAHTCARTNEQTLCWGDNSYGQTDPF